MLIEHIARGRYIVDFTDNEWQTLKQIAVGFHKGNLCTTIRQINEAGIQVYRDLLQEGFDHDEQYERSLKIIARDLVEPDSDNEPGTKSGSAIESED